MLPAHHEQVRTDLACFAERGGTSDEVQYLAGRCGDNVMTIYQRRAVRRPELNKGVGLSQSDESIACAFCFGCEVRQQAYPGSTITSVVIAVLRVSRADTTQCDVMTTVRGIETVSKRAFENANSVDYWAAFAKVYANAWSPDNPDGVVILGMAENCLMHNEIERHVTASMVIDAKRHFTYCNGPRGSHLLSEALSVFFNNYFHPIQPTEPDEVIITSGVAASTDGLTFSVCDEGEGILFPQPLYTGFNPDVRTRSRGKVVPVSFERDDGKLVLDDVFDADANLRCLERAYQQSEANGVKVKAVMITNPHNPVGRCYSAETIKVIATFCAKYNLHYISDEIYALSVFDNASFPQAPKFTSVLAVGLDSVIRPELVHVLYGAAKDFNIAGLRLGVLYSRNPAIRAAVGSLLAYAWNPNFVQDIWARILSDKSFLSEFITRNQSLLSKHYRIATSFFDAHNISYYPGGNATLFIWADFRRRLLPNGKDEDFKLSSPQAQEVIRRQDLLEARCQQLGVFVGKGQKFTPEEIGWFRITFSARENALKVGLKRIADALESLELSNWA